MPEFLSDGFLARRLERAEAVANARFVEARARAEPDSGARWMEVAGTYAMYDAPRSPCTQTFGLGLFQMPTPADIIGPVEWSSVLYLPLGAWLSSGSARENSIQVRLVGPEEQELWARTAADGWRDSTDAADLPTSLMRVNAQREDPLSFLAEWEGRSPPAASSYTTAWPCWPAPAPFANGAIAVRNGRCSKSAWRTPRAPDANSP